MLLDYAVVNKENLVCVTNCGEAMCDHNSCRFIRLIENHFCQLIFRNRVKRGRRLVKYQQSEVTVQQSR